MGYAGGEKLNPTYRDMGDHTEVVQIDYDPEQVSYERLLALFWGSHSPTNKPYRRQYMSLILANDTSQQEKAVLSAEQVKARFGRVYTEIAPLTKFYLAEDYHQKYYLSRVPILMQELIPRFADFASYGNSTIVARINGYVGGYGNVADFEREAASFELSSACERRLAEIVSSHS